MSYRNLIVDTFDLSTLGLRVQNIAGHRDEPEAVWPNVKVPGRFGPVVMSAYPERKARKIVVYGIFDSTSLPALYTALDETKARLGDSERDITVVDNESRVFKARVSKFQVQSLPPELETPRANVTISLFCADPRAYSTGDTVVNFGATAVDTPLGTAPTDPVIRVSGPAAAPAVIYRSSTGGERSRVTLATTLSSTDWIDIDMASGTVLDKSGASQTSVFATTVSSFFALDPGDGTYWSSGWPTLEVSAGSAAATYRKAYL